MSPLTTFRNAVVGRPKRSSIRRNVIGLSLPVLLSSLFQRLVSIVDIFLVGGLGAAAIAATGLGQLLIFVVMTVFWGLATGTTVILSKSSLVTVLMNKPGLAPATSSSACCCCPRGTRRPTPSGSPAAGPTRRS